MKTLILALVIITILFVGLNILFPLSHISPVVYVGGYIGVLLIWVFTALEL
jgi:hypothetical protein